MPVSPTGVGAGPPAVPTILGATNAITWCTTPSLSAGAASPPPHSQKSCRNPRRAQYRATTSGVSSSNSITSTPAPRSAA